MSELIGRPISGQSTSNQTGTQRCPVSGGMWVAYSVNVESIMTAVNQGISLDSSQRELWSQNAMHFLSEEMATDHARKP
jgi:hypothetical protein